MSIKSIRSLKANRDNKRNQSFYKNIVIGDSISSIILFNELEKTEKSSTLLIYSKDLDFTSDLFFTLFSKKSYIEINNILSQDSNVSQEKLLVESQKFNSFLKTSSEQKKLTNHYLKKLTQIECDILNISDINKFNIEDYNESLKKTFHNINSQKETIQSIQSYKSTELEQSFLERKNWFIKTSSSNDYTCEKIYFNLSTPLENSFQNDLELKKEIQSLKQDNNKILMYKLLLNKVIDTENIYLTPFTSENDDFFISLAQNFNKKQNQEIIVSYLFSNDNIEEDELNRLISKKIKKIKSKVKDIYFIDESNIKKEFISLGSLDWVSEDFSKNIENFNQSSENVFITNLALKLNNDRQ